MAKYNRRKVLVGIGATATLPLLSKMAFSDVGPGYVDAHVHAWSNDTDAYPLIKGKTRDNLNPPAMLATSYLERGKEFGINKYVLVQPGILGTDNSYMIDASKETPGHFAIVAYVDQKSDSAGDEMVKLKAQGVKGFRVRGHDTASWIASPVMNKMYEVAATEELNMCPLVRNAKLGKKTKMDDDAFLHMGTLSEKHPDTVVVIDHMGAVRPDDEMQLGRLMALAKHKNIYVKISGFNKSDIAPYNKIEGMIGKLIGAFGVERLMWASDLPGLEKSKNNSLGAAFEVINSNLGLSKNEKDWILGKTAVKVFFN